MSGYSLAMSSVEENISFCSLNKIQTQLAILLHEVNWPQLGLNEDLTFTSCEMYVLYCNSTESVRVTLFCLFPFNFASPLSGSYWHCLWHPGSGECQDHQEILGSIQNEGRTWWSGNLHNVCAQRRCLDRVRSSESNSLSRYTSFEPQYLHAMFKSVIECACF